MPLPINRRENVYHRYDGFINRLHNEDYIASTLLQIAYSHMNRFIQFNCVAVCFVNDELWVASNSQDIITDDIRTLSLLMREDGYNIYPSKIKIIVFGCRNVMHAEMQLLAALRNKFIDTIGSQHIYIGVSKPCCQNCAFMLDAYAVNYTQYHSNRVRNWELPYVFL